MAILTYDKNGKQFFRVYVQGRGKVDTSIRVQKNKFGIDTLKDARREEKKLIKAVTDEINMIEGRGLKWEDVIFRWKTYASQGLLGDKQRDPHYINDHVNRLTRYTQPWLNRVASDLTKGDGRLVLSQAKDSGCKVGQLKKIKSSVNVIFKWAIEEKLVVGVQTSPTEGVNVSDKAERVPKILTLEEIKIFLQAAKQENHPWYHIWSFAFLTGMRSGELKALQWKDIDFERRIISVSKSYSDAKRVIKCTKAGYWRNVPISKDLQQIMMELKQATKCDAEDFVLPRHGTWDNGEAGKVLRAFLKKYGINTHVVFHTLRACFATHMLAQGVDQATVMKIGGWRDIKTFQIYVRLAGVEVKGATDVLQVIPKMESLAPRENVIDFLGHKTGGV